jgi:hypothetical protein
MSHHKPRQKLTRDFGATDIVTERGDEGMARIKDMTGGIGTGAVLECVGTSQSMTEALRSTRPGRFVGVPHGLNLAGEELCYSHAGSRGGPAPCAASCPNSSTWYATARSTRQGVRPDAAA